MTMREVALSQREEALLKRETDLEREREALRQQRKMQQESERDSLSLNMELKTLLQQPFRHSVTTAGPGLLAVGSRCGDLGH